MTRYELGVGEPWDFEGPDGANRILVDFGGFISGPNLPGWGYFMLLKVVTPFQYNNDLVELMIASPRYVGDTVDEIVKQGGIIGIASVRPGVSLVSGNSFIIVKLSCTH